MDGVTNAEYRAAMREAAFAHDPGNKLANFYLRGITTSAGGPGVVPLTMNELSEFIETQRNILGANDIYANFVIDFDSDLPLERREVTASQLADIVIEHHLAVPEPADLAAIPLYLHPTEARIGHFMILVVAIGKPEVTPMLFDNDASSPEMHKLLGLDILFSELPIYPKNVISKPLSDPDWVTCGHFCADFCYQLFTGMRPEKIFEDPSWYSNKLEENIRVVDWWLSFERPYVP
jgi:hypothetical protein